MKILLVEDEDRIASFLAKGLGAQGYAVSRVATGNAAISDVSGDLPDLVILDLGLPDRDGLDVLKHLRNEGREVPVIVLTARGGVDERVLGLDLGADDYLAKPFAFEELLARVRARLRPRKGPTATELRSGEIALNLLTRDVRFGDRPIPLTPREFTLLHEFLRHPGQVLTREQLLSSVWGLGFDPGSNTVDVYVGYLRRKIGEAVIETVRGVGYRLTEPGAAADPDEGGSRTGPAPGVP
jgi:DNA-binding response OmpR family regulator